METQFFFNILIVSAIVTQGICSLSEESEQSSDIQIRKKRIIDPRKSYVVSSITLVPYIVNIEKISDNSSLCGGTILDWHIIITTADCVPDDRTLYRILSGSHIRNHGNPHIILKKYIHQNYNRQTLAFNLALLIISPHIIGFPNEKIDIYEGPLPHSNAYCTLSGWGCIYSSGTRTIFPVQLRSVEVQMMKKNVCKNIYRPYKNVSYIEICTMDRTGQTGSSLHDTGGPLVFNRRLVGVLSWTKVIQNRRFPDVYVFLGDNSIHTWINTLRQENRHYLIDLNHAPISTGSE